MFSVKQWRDHEIWVRSHCHWKWHQSKDRIRVPIHTGRKSRFVHTHMHSTPPLGCVRRNTAIKFGTEKMQWCGYTTVKSFENMFNRLDTLPERDRRTDRICCIDIARQHCCADARKKNECIMQRQVMQRIALNRLSMSIKTEGQRKVLLRRCKPVR